MKVAKKQRRNVSQKRALKAAALSTFVRQYGRKAYKTHDPNDRTYDRDVEKAVKRMEPAELDRLLRDDES